MCLQELLLVQEARQREVRFDSQRHLKVPESCVLVVVSYAISYDFFNKRLLSDDCLQCGAGQWSPQSPWLIEQP